MKRWMLLLLSCVVLGCSSPFVSIDPEAYRAETVSAAPVEPTAAPGPDAPVSDAPEPTLRPLLREAYAIPETVQFDELEGHMTLTGTAVVEVPDVSALPRATAKRAAFDQDTVDALYRACFPSGGTFDYSELNGGYSKAELDAMLGVLTRYEAMSRVKSVRYFCETERKRLLALYDDALDAIPREATKPQLTDGKVTLMSAPMWNLGNVFAVDNAVTDGDASFTYLYEMDPTLNFFRTNETTYRRDVTRISRVRGLKPEGSMMQTDPYTAAELVQSFLREANLPSFTTERVAWYRNGRSVPEWYLVSCKRSVGGVPITSVYPFDSFHVTQSRRAYLEAAGTGAAWMLERLVFVVADTGIRRIYWDRPIALIEEGESDAELIPFSEVVELIRAVLHDVDRDRTVDMTETIDSIALTMVIWADPDAAETGTLVPAWAVYFTRRMGQSTDFGASSMLLIRADTGEVAETLHGPVCHDAACVSGLEVVPAVLGTYRFRE